MHRALKRDFIKKEPGITWGDVKPGLSSRENVLSAFRKSVYSILGQGTALNLIIT
jgi:hypothetical protein